MPVVATFSVIGDIVRQIGGDRVAVTILVPPDGDAHVYEPKPADLIAIRQARVVVVNGLGMEGWMDRLVRASGTKAEIVVATRGVASRRMVEEGHATTDPHAWQDPRNGLIYASNVADGLSRADPAGAAVYRAGADRLSAALRETDTWIAAQFAGIAPARRKIITSHDAFGYFGARYGIKFVGVQGISTDAEPSARDIAALVAQIRRERIKAVFVENMTDPRVAAALAREAGASVGPTVYSDALSPPGGPADTYLGMFRHNVPLFARAMAAN
jgi:zinc/manganese transport system substrate-binding protein